MNLFYFLFGIFILAGGLFLLFVGLILLFQTEDFVVSVFGLGWSLGAICIIVLAIALIRSAFTGKPPEFTKPTPGPVQVLQELKVKGLVYKAVALEGVSGENPAPTLEAERIPADHVAIGRVGVTELKLQEEGQVRARSRVQRDLEALEIRRKGVFGAKQSRVLTAVVESLVEPATSFDHNMGPEQLDGRTAQALDLGHGLVAFDVPQDEKARDALSPRVAYEEVVDSKPRKKRHQERAAGHEPLSDRVHANRLRALAAGGWL